MYLQADSCVSDSVSQTLYGLVEAFSGQEKCAARSQRKEMSSEYSLYPLHQPKVYSGQSVTHCLRIKFGNYLFYRLNEMFQTCLA